MRLSILRSAVHSATRRSTIGEAVHGRRARSAFIAAALVGLPMAAVTTGGFTPAFALSSVAGHVFADNNHNGVADAGDTDLSGITVTATDASGANVGTTVSAGDGTYTISVATAGPLRVQFTPGTSVTNIGVPRTAIAGSREVQFVTAPATGVDFGMYDRDTFCNSGCFDINIGDRVWFDTNGDQQDAGEPGIAGVQVELLDASGNSFGAPVYATTDPNGYYLFANQASSPAIPNAVVTNVLQVNTSYRVRVNNIGSGPLRGLTPTANGGGVILDSDGLTCSSGGAPATGTFCDPLSGLVSVGNTGGGMWNMNIDFGFQPYDLAITKSNNAAGPLSPGATVTYTLTVTNEGPGTVNSGWTISDLLPAGLTYAATPSGCAIDGVDPQLMSCNGASSLVKQVAGNPHVTFTIAATVDAGAGTGTLKNVAWVAPPVGDIPAAETNPLVVPTIATDTVGSSTNNDAESTITVTPATTTTTTPGATTTTTPGATTTTTTPGATTTTTPGATTTTSPGATTTTGPATTTTTTPGTAGLGDFVWVDQNRDGQQDTNEVGLWGVPVRLLDPSGTVLKSTATDLSGKYLFSNLAPGAYQVEITPLTGYFMTYEHRVI